jgi:hypothetical protein
MAYLPTFNYQLTFCILFAAVSSALLENQATAQDDALENFRGDIVIRVTKDSTIEDCIKVEPVTIGKETGDVLTNDQGIEWSIDADSELVCSLSGRKLVISDDGSKDVWVEASTAKLQKDKPGQLELSIPKPQLLKPGFYQGNIRVTFSLPTPDEPIEIKGYWQVTVAVAGRLLDSFRFDAAKNDKLRVGEPASVTAIIHTIDCEIGSGDLTVEFENAGSKESALHLPIPLAKVMDPLTMLKREGDSLHPKWFDNVITSKVVETKSKFIDSENLHQAYAVQLRMPACFKPGNILADLDWEQSENAPTEAGKSIEGKNKLNSNVQGGIHVSPQLCSTRELVTVKAVSPTDLGASIKLVFKGPNGESFPAVAEKPSYEGGKAVGDYFEYEVKFSAPTTGQWTVSWPAGDEKLSKALGTPRTFDAWLENSTDNLAVPLTVFASPTPLGWGIFPDPYQGNGWIETRQDALVIRVNDQFIKNVKITPLGIFKVDETTNRMAIYDPAKEPTIKMTPNVKKEKSEVPIDYISVPKDGVTFNATVSVDKENEDHPGNRVSLRAFYYRALIEGTGPQGESVQKLITIRIDTNITTDWEWYKTKIWWTFAVVIFLGILFFIYRSANPKIKTDKTLVSNVGAVPNDDGMQGFGDEPATPQEAATPEEPDDTSDPGSDDGGYEHSYEDDDDDGEDDMAGFGE